jgi:hypothetical protein
MENKGSLSYSQQPTTVPYPEPDESSPHRHTYNFFPSDFPNKKKKHNIHRNCAVGLKIMTHFNTENI